MVQNFVLLETLLDDHISINVCCKVHILLRSYNQYQNPFSKLPGRIF